MIEAIGAVEWGKKTLSVRINGLDTPYWYRDVVDLLENASDRLDQIMIPKVGNAADIYTVDALVSAIEAAKGRQKRINFEVIIEFCGRHCSCRRNRRRIAPPCSHEPRGCGLRGLDGHADHRHRRHAGKLLYAARWGAALF